MRSRTVAALEDLPAEIAVFRPEPGAIGAASAAVAGLPAPAVASAMRILEFLARESPRAGLTELSRGLGLNKSTCYNILLTLGHFGAVTRSVDSAKYQLGPKLAELGGAVRRHFWQRDLLRRYFETLIAESQLVCLVGQVLGDERSFVIIDQIMPPGSNVASPAQPVGTVYPLTGAALGCAILSCYDEDDAIAIARSFNVAQKPAEERAWRQQLRDIRQRGYARSVEHYQREVNAVAVPIEKSDEPLLAVALVGYVRDFPTSKVDEIGRRLVNEAREFQIRLGSSGGGA